jgi:hypothetical protein
LAGQAALDHDGQVVGGDLGAQTTFTVEVSRLPRPGPVEVEITAVVPGTG